MADSFVTSVRDPWAGPAAVAGPSELSAHSRQRHRSGRAREPPAWFDGRVDVASLWDFADPAASAARFADALADAPEPDALVLRTQLARALGLQGLYGAAWAELDLVAAAGSGDLEVTVREALERGRVLRDSTDLQGTSPGTAADHVARAARLAAGSTDPDIAGLHVDALHMLALLADTPQEQVRLTEQALAVATTSTAAPARRWRASLLNNLGMAHHDTGDDEAALVSFERALDLRRAAAGGDADPQVSVARWMVAWASPAARSRGGGARRADGPGG